MERRILMYWPDIIHFRLKKLMQLLAICLLLLVSSLFAFGADNNDFDSNELSSAKGLQGPQISGTVLGEDGTPLPGVNIIEKGTTNGTTTDLNGNFELVVTSTESVISCSYIGYLSEELVVGSQTNFTVNLVPDLETLEEVVVVGYGTQKKATLTGAVASVNGEALKKSPAINFSNTLSGRIPGVITYNRGGEPGYDEATIRIRGTNSIDFDPDDDIHPNDPLIVVDGIAGRSLDRLDPNDIESVSVLKDASAAIYGAQAANGVILITTKRGEAGKPTISFNYNQGWTTPTIIPPMADAATYATMINEVKMYRGLAPQYTDDEIQKFRDGSDPWNYPNTDWYGEVFQDYTSQNTWNGTVNGGTENLRYFLSVGGRFQDGIYVNSATNYQQYNFRSNIDGKISNNINWGMHLKHIKIINKLGVYEYPEKSNGI